MEHWDYDWWFFGFEDEFAYSHFEETHGEIGRLVDSCFWEDVDPTVVGIVEEFNRMVHGRLADSSGTERWMSINW